MGGCTMKLWLVCTLPLGVSSPLPSSSLATSLCKLEKQDANKAWGLSFETNAPFPPLAALAQPVLGLKKVMGTGSLWLEFSRNLGVFLPHALPRAPFTHVKHPWAKLCCQWHLCCASGWVSCPA